MDALLITAHRLNNIIVNTPDLFSIPGTYRYSTMSDHPAVIEAISETSGPILQSKQSDVAAVDRWTHCQGELCTHHIAQKIR